MTGNKKEWEKIKGIGLRMKINVKKRGIEKIVNEYLKEKGKKLFNFYFEYKIKQK